MPAPAAVKAIFLEAAAIEDPVARAALVADRCGADATLRARVYALLVANEKAMATEGTVTAMGDAGVVTVDRPKQDWVPDPIPATVDRPGKDEHVGAVLGGKYKLIEAIGEGGMGSVFMAQQTEPVKRAVAVKVIKAGMDSKAVLARFEAERQALAMMDHPNIARVLDAGTTESGRPYFVMELVKGVPITQFCDERKLTPRQRLELFVPVCNAIQHAHQKGVIHRDIKPSNVLVAMYDDRPVPKVIDFGVAKAAGQTLTDKTLMTGFGAVVGTPEYMSPEQANLNNLDIDTRSDVYSLGVLLYELLTGHTPVDRKSLGKAALLEILRIVREVEPPRPSAKLSTIDTLPSVAANRGTEPAKLSKLMKGELDWLVLKALEKDRTRRYETANGFAADVNRYLSGEAVQAHPPSAGYKLKKFVRRNPLQLAMAGMAAVLVLGGVSVAWWQAEQTGVRREADLRRQLQDEQRASADAARLARNAEAVASLLGQAEESLKANDAAKAAVVLDAATKRSAEGGAEQDGDRLKRLAADLALLRDLDAVDQFRWTVEENKFQDPAKVATRTREALTRFGADPDTESVDHAAGRVTASVVRARLVSALDRLLRYQKTNGVRALLRKVDADPYRDAVRDAVLANDRVKIVELAGQKAALEQPSGFAAFLGDSGAIPVERRRQLLQAAVSRRPGDLGLLMTLGGSYLSNKEDGADEGLRWYQAAVAAAPANAAANNNLGKVLNDKPDRVGAEAAFREAIRLDPKFAMAHFNLGNVLYAKPDRVGAEAAYREAIRLDPKDAKAHYGLGLVLQAKPDRVGAEAAFREAIRLDSKLAVAYGKLGLVLQAKPDRVGAEAAFREAIRLDPKDAEAHNNLGILLSDKPDRVGAEAALREAIRLDPKLALAHNNLGLVLLASGQYADAKVHLDRALTLLPEKHPSRTLASRQMQVCERMLKLEARLPKLLRGEDKVDSAPESLSVAEMCQHKKLYATGARFSAEAFAADPKLADDLQAQHRYNAACSAALAAASQGEDAAKLNEAAMAKLRGQARDWLRADLALRTKQLESGKPADRAEVQKTMLHWQKDPDMAGIRDAAALAKLPADEQKAFTQLWADVATLLKKAEEKGNPGPPPATKDPEKKPEPAPPPRTEK